MTVIEIESLTHDYQTGLWRKRSLRALDGLSLRVEAAYRFGEVFLPYIDADAAIRFVERGIRNNPDEWRLYQDLEFVQWRRRRFR